jgi:nucleotide-binding universal stress UspA family protein
MIAVVKPAWSKPSTILFATEVPANEKAFGFALAQAVEFGANLVIFHAYDRAESGAFETCVNRHNDFSQDRAEKSYFETLSERAANVGIHCRIVVRQGPAADRILAFLRERKVDRIVMGTHSPGPIGKLLVGSVAEAVLRSANAPVCIVGPNVVESSYRHLAIPNILCDVSKREASRMVAAFGAELAARRNANLILQQVIPPQEQAEWLAGRTLSQLEEELPFLIPARLHNIVNVQTRAVIGDPAEEMIYGGRARKAHLIVVGAQGASQFAAITRAASIYKALAYAHCPVMTLSPVLLAGCSPKGPREEILHRPEVNFMAGVV